MSTNPLIVTFSLVCLLLQLSCRYNNYSFWCFCNINVKFWTYFNNFTFDLLFWKTSSHFKASFWFHKCFFLAFDLFRLFLNICCLTLVLARIIMRFFEKHSFLTLVVVGKVAGGSCSCQCTCLPVMDISCLSFRCCNFSEFTRVLTLNANILIYDFSLKSGPVEICWTSRIPSPVQFVYLCL